jgi:hypothetical protein
VSAQKHKERELFILQLLQTKWKLEEGTTSIYKDKPTEEKHMDSKVEPDSKSWAKREKNIEIPF